MKQLSVHTNNNLDNKMISKCNYLSCFVFVINITITS